MTKPPVLAYGVPRARARLRTGPLVACVLAAIVGLVAFAIGCVVLFLWAMFDLGGDDGFPFVIIALYFAIGGVCAYAAVRWGRRAVSG